MLGERIEDSKRSGRFTVAPGRDVYGELTLAGRDTSLYLHDKDPFNTHAAPDWCLKGVLLDLTRITLVDCITTEGTGSATKGDDRYHFAKVFPTTSSTVTNILRQPTRRFQKLAL